MSPGYTKTEQCSLEFFNQLPSDILQATSQKPFEGRLRKLLDKGIRVYDEKEFRKNIVTNRSNLQDR